MNYATSRQWKNKPELMKMVSYREEGGEDRNVCMILFWIYHFYIVLTSKPISWKIKLNSKIFLIENELKQMTLKGNCNEILNFIQ